MRAFIALELPREVKEELKKVQAQLKRAGIKATWVKPEITHLTLAFLGSITHRQVQIIHKVLEEEVRKSSPLKLKLGLINCFPRPDKPRVIFVELKGEIDKLNRLVKQIRQGLKKEKIGFDDTPPAAHVTVGRVKKRSNLTHVLKDVKVNKIKFLAQEITLYQSQLTPSGPIYTKLSRALLT